MNHQELMALTAAELDMRKFMQKKLDIELLPYQIRPIGDWSIWMMIGGRGTGKTQLGVHETIEHLRIYKLDAWVTIIAPTISEAYKTILHGKSGLMSKYRSEFTDYNKTLRTAVHYSGGRVTVFGGEVPDRVRGSQSNFLWFDELTSSNPETFTQAQIANRLPLPDGNHPRTLITTTPKPKPFLKKLMKQDGVVITRATIYENPHLDKNQVKFLEQLYGGSEMGRQELLGELIEKVKGALWDYQNIEDNRVLETEVPELSRTVVAIDPAVTSKTTSDETAISVVGKEPKNEYVPEEQFYLLENEGMREPPHVWARRAIDLYHKYEADAIVAEVNNGGDMVEHTIKTIWPNAPVKQVRATKGKVTRAEPSSLLYQKNCVHHVGVFGPLEDQMVNFGYESKPEHDDRVDSLVWAITELSTDEPFFYFG